MAREIVWNFAELLEEVRGLLFKLAEKDQTAGAMARVLKEHFSELPENARAALERRLKNH